MHDFVECPVCEQQFPEPEESAEHPRCPGCGSTIPRERLRRIDKRVRAATPDTISADKVHAPRRLQTTETRPVSPPPAVMGFSDSLGGADFLSEELPGQALAGTEIKANRRGPRRARPWQSLLVLGLALASVGGLFALVVLLSGPSDEGSADAQASARSTEAKTSPIDAALGDAGPEVDKTPLDLPPDHFSQSRRDATWQLIYPFLVRLEIETPTATKTATGVLIDTRGWVATSYQSIQDAGRVRVTFAASKPGDDSPFQELTDLARGIISTDPQHDLAIIAINRAQVVDFREVALAADHDVVPPERFLIARVPPRRHRSWLTECRVSERARWKDLQASTGGRPTSAPTTDESLVWIVYPEQAPGKSRQSLLGSPLFDSDGRLIAMNTGAEVPGKILAVPAKNLASLKTSATNDVHPFPRRDDLLDLSTASSNDAEEDRWRASLMDTAEAVRQSIARCEDTGWIADSAEEYRHFQELASQIVEMQQFVYSEPQAENHEQLVQQELDRVTRQMVVSLVEDLNPEELDKPTANQWFETQVNARSPAFLMYADVHRGAASSPGIRGQETISLKLTGSDQIVLSPFTEHYKDLRPGRRFLFIGQLDPVLRGGNLRVVNLLYSFEVEKPEDLK